jgi:hypothetical protein
VTTVIIVIVAVVIVIAIVAAIALRARQRSALRGTFGSEYDRTVDDAGSKRAAERELKERKSRHDELEIRPLDPTVAQRYRDAWRLVQERFVDAPAEAVASAHRLLQDALGARGYPTRDDDERVAMLSVDHADVLDEYRSGMRTEQAWRERGSSDTEDLRLAMQHYRSVFERVVGEAADDAYPQDGEGSDAPRARQARRTTGGVNTDQ